MVIQRASQIVSDPLSNRRGQILLREAADRAADGNHQHRQRNEQEEGQLVRANS